MLSADEQAVVDWMEAVGRGKGHGGAAAAAADGAAPVQPQLSRKLKQAYSASRCGPLAARLLAAVPKLEMLPLLALVPGLLPPCIDS